MTIHAMTKMPVPMIGDWNMAFKHISELFADEAKKSHNVPRIIEGSVDDLANDRCVDCGGVLVRFDNDRIIKQDYVLMSGIIQCPSIHTESHPKRVWLEIWYWPTGKHYSDFLKSKESSAWLFGYLDKYRKNPFSDIFTHSDSKIPICYDANDFNITVAMEAFLLFQLDGHKGRFPFPYYLHKSVYTAGVRPHSDLLEYELEYAKQTIRERSPQ